MSEATSHRTDGGRAGSVLALPLLVIAIEFVYRAQRLGQLHGLALLTARVMEPVLVGYAAVRTWTLDHPIAAIGGGGLAVVAAALTYRAALLVWHNEIATRISGTHFRQTEEALPMLKVDVLREIARRPLGSIFIGREPVRRLAAFWSSRPVYMTHRQKTMHRHVLGKTGSGKTLSVAFVGMLQDLLDGKGLLDMSAKGSDEEIGIIKALAATAHREGQLRVLSLPAWNRPEIFSHTYNMVYVRPRAPGDEGGDPIATAERVFSVLPLGNEPYYNTQAEIFFTNLIKLLHGIVDEQRNGIPFVIRDLAVCITGAGSEEWKGALEYCLLHSLDRDAARLITQQIKGLGKEVGKCFSGLRGAIDKFLSPLVNAYDPDIIFEEVLEQDLLVYVQLPSNLFPIQAPAMGRVILQDVQQEGALRQVFRTKRNQNPFAVYLDEFYTFANVRVIDGLNKLRDAHVEYTLLHQSIADLEMVSREFASVVWDNTRTKDVLSQDNPELCEKLARSIGTHEVIETTVRRERGPLFTSLATGDASTKLVEAYKLHPNRIKTLATSGQGYLYNGEGIKPLVYGMLPAGLVADYQLPQKDQTRARGLRLYERFIAGKVAEAVADAAEPSVARPCPRCGSPLRLRVGKRGDFVACTGYPDCDYIGDPRAEPSPLKCHKCSGPMEEVEGKFGRYAQCVARDCRARVAVGHERHRKQ
jgi:hypothetical protein